MLLVNEKHELMSERWPFHFLTINHGVEKAYESQKTSMIVL